MKFILFSGYIGSGKSFAAEQLQKYIPKSKIAAFGDKLKDDAAIYFKFPRDLCNTQDGKLTFIPKYNMTVRDLLIQYSADMKSTHGNDVWANYVADDIRNNSHITHWIINDWRYPEELKVLQQAFPDSQFITVRIHRNSVQPKPFPSEHALDNYTFNHIITNDNTADELLSQFINNINII